MRQATVARSSCRWPAATTARGRRAIGLGGLRALAGRPGLAALGAMVIFAGCAGAVGGGSGAAPGSGGTAGAPRDGGGLPGSGGISGGAAGGGAAGSPVIRGGGGAGPTSTLCDGLTNRRLRRLSAREYTNVVSDLLGTTFRATVQAALPFEPRLGGFDNQDSALFVSASLQETIANLAEKIASQVDPMVLAPCATAAGSPACLQTFMRSFALKAYGRPLAAAELTRMNAVASMGENYATSVRLVVELVLQSPHLLYLSELGAEDAPPAPGQPLRLTPYEIASQLSFLLSGSRPDGKLIQAAETTRFALPEHIRAEVDRLLPTESARAELARFIVGWLDMAPIAESPKDPTVFPELTPAVLGAMQQEFDQFVTAQLRGGDGTLAGFMTAQSTNIPAALAPIYGADLKAGVLDAKHRSGVLSLPGLLTYHSSDQHSGPVERGLFVRRQLLCTEVPPPPPAALARIAANPVDTADKTRTTRQKFAAHVSEPSCMACHQFFDPIGFGLEQMDGLGRFRTTENGLPVDSTGQLTATDVDGPFQGAVELSSKLATSKQFETCMVDHFFRFAQARPTDSADDCVVREWDSQFSQGGARIKDLVLAYTAHRTFTNRKDDR